MKGNNRIFIAINLPEDVKKYLSRLEGKWKDLPARWTKKSNLHITLAFLDYIDNINLGKACIAAKETALRHSPFNIRFKKICYGPIGKDLPKMVWLLGEKSRELSLLRKDLENSLIDSIGYKPEARAFSPHVTLARISQMELRMLDFDERPQIDENIDLEFEVSSVEAMESVLKKGGPEHTIIESFSLA